MKEIKFRAWGKNICYSYHQELEVTVSRQVFDCIIRYCGGANNKEVGGILIGAYSSDNKSVIISSVSGPTEDSVMKPHSFVRGTRGLQKLLSKKWKEGKYYVGEWHYHPSSSPEPSRQDLKQMKSFASNKKLNCPEPVLFIIGGDRIRGWSSSVHIITKNEIVQMEPEI